MSYELKNAEEHWISNDNVAEKYQSTEVQKYVGSSF